jgi:dTDP-4-dehydrorhamnose reductase
VVAPPRSELDLCDEARVATAVDSIRPDVILNCAAFNAVDLAEDKPLDALRANAFAVGSLARAAGRIGATLVHYGTDFVFDGDSSTPYRESDAPNPRSVYGASKLLGEYLARETDRHYVLRVESLFGGPLAKGSVDRIVSDLSAGRECRVFVDRSVSPAYVEDIVTATLAILEKALPHGLYHCVNTGFTTWHDLAVEAARILGVAPRLVPVPSSALSLRAPRPLFCALSNSRLSKAGVPIPTWGDALRRHLSSPRSTP